MGNTVLVQKMFKNDSEFDRFHWVLKARSSDILRKPLLGMFISPDHWAVCTDGHRLHMYHIERMTALEPGIYFPVEGGINKKLITLERDEENLEYPDYKRILPEGTPEKWISFSTGSDTTVFTYLASQIACSNIKYVSEAFIPNTMITLKAWKKGDNLSLIEGLEYRTELDPETKKDIQTVCTKSIIMPLRENFTWEYPEPEPEIPATDLPTTEFETKTSSETDPEPEPAIESPAIESPEPDDGVSGQDRESYADVQDREYYVPEPGSIGM